MSLLDASALLAFVAQEPGSEKLPAASTANPWLISVVNWSEVYQKLSSRHVETRDIEALEALFPLHIVPITKADAVAAAQLWQAHPHLSIADRCCLALGQRLEEVIYTTDKAWASFPAVELLR